MNGLASGRAPRLRGTLAPPPDKSISHRAALLGAMSAAPVRVTNYLAVGRHRTRRSRRSARSARASRSAHGRARDPTAPACAARAAGARDRRRQRRHAAAAAARLARRRRTAAAGRSTATQSIRRRPVDRVAEPLRAMGARLEAREERFTPLAIHGARRCTGSSTRCRSRPPRSSRACCSPGLLADGRHDRRRARAEPRPHRAAAAPRAGAAVRRDGDARHGRRRRRLALDAIHVPGDPSSAAFHVAAAVLVPRLAAACRGMSASTGPASASCASSSGWARIVARRRSRTPARRRAGAEPWRRSRSRTAR